MKMEFSVDPRTNRLGPLYISFSDKAVEKTVPAVDPADPEVLIDLDKNDDVVGIEILSPAGIATLKEFCQALTKRVPQRFRKQVKKRCLPI